MYHWFIAFLLSEFSYSIRVMYVIRAFMYLLSHKYTILHVRCQGFHAPLESCDPRVLLCYV